LGFRSPFDECTTAAAHHAGWRTQPATMPSFALLRRSPKRVISPETTEDEASRNGSPKSPRSPAASDIPGGFGDGDKKPRVSTRELLYEIRSRLVGKPPPSTLRTPQRGRAASQPQPQRSYAASAVRQMPSPHSRPLRTCTSGCVSDTRHPTPYPREKCPVHTRCFPSSTPRLRRGSRVRVERQIRQMHRRIASLLFQPRLVALGWSLVLGVSSSAVTITTVPYSLQRLPRLL
jgi:hypothetical protein